MPRIFTLGDLVTRAKQRADMENGSFLSAAEWKGHISTLYAELYSEIVATGLRHFERTKAVTTTGAASYAIPDDFLSLCGVDYKIDSAGHRRALRELMAHERNVYRGESGSAAVAYSLAGTGAASGSKPLALYPTPPSGQTYEIVYVPQPPDLTSAADSTRVDVVTPDGEAFVLWGVAVLALGKEESDFSLAINERERMRERVREWAVLRSFHEGRRHYVAGDPWEGEP